jgi:hypothetical protein
MTVEKKYIEGLWIYEKEFSNWWKILNVNVDVEKLYLDLLGIKDEKGFARIVIAKKQKQEEKKPSHYVYEDTYKKSN